MRRCEMKKFICLILVFFGISIMMAVNTAAYLDPSVMTYLIQVIVGIGIAGSAVFVVYWKKIKLFFKKKFKK